MSKQPNSRDCFICGLENPVGLKMAFYNLGPEELEAKYTIPDRYQGFPGFAHKGVVTAMLDEVMTRTALIADTEHFMYTVEMDLNFHHPVPTGQPLRLTGQAGRYSHKISKVAAQLYGPEGRLLAEAEGWLMDIPEEDDPTGEGRLVGWRVYPDEEETV